MGICTSCEATAVGPTPTAKLILADGKLVEFERATKVSKVLEKDLDSFVCDADDMEFDRYVSAVRSEEELKLGQIYFVLPRSMLKRPLRSEDLAALALKASRGLTNGRSTPLVFGVAKSEKTMVVRKRGEKGVGCGRGRNFETDLSAIVE